jgi:hypothetical protein
MPVIAILTPAYDFDKAWRGSIPTRFSDRNSGYEEISVHFLKKPLERFERLERFEPNFEGGAPCRKLYR